MKDKEDYALKVLELQDQIEQLQEENKRLKLTLRHAQAEIERLQRKASEAAWSQTNWGA